MRFNGICLISDNVRRLRDFYVDVLQAEADGENVFVFIKTEGAMFSIYDAERMEGMASGSTADSGTGRCTIEFEADDPEREYERLTAMDIPIVKPITTQPWGRTSFWFRDPDGNIVNFYKDLSN